MKNTKKSSSAKKLTLAQRKLNAKKFFETESAYGPWIMDHVMSGMDEAGGGAVDVATENPDDARHARQLSKKEHGEAFYKNILSYMKTPKGKKSILLIAAVMHDDLT